MNCHTVLERARFAHIKSPPKAKRQSTGIRGPGMGLRDICAPARRKQACTCACEPTCTRGACGLYIVRSRDPVVALRVERRQCRHTVRQPTDNPALSSLLSAFHVSLATQSQTRRRCIPSRTLGLAVTNERVTIAPVDEDARRARGGGRVW